MSTTPSLARPPKRRKRNPPLPPPKSYAGPTRITPQEACALLGISKHSLYRMAKDRRIPAQPIGIEGWGFYRQPLEEWLKQQLSHGLEGQP